MGIGGYLVYSGKLIVEPHTTNTYIPHTTPQPNNETANWKTLYDSTGSPNIKFSFMYPTYLNVMSVSGIPSKQVTNDINNVPKFEQGYFSLFGTRLNLDNKDDETKIISKKDIMLGGKKGVRILQPDSNIPNLVKRIEYRVTELNIPGDKKWGFALECFFIPKKGIDLEGFCDQISATFKFIQ